MDSLASCLRKLRFRASHYFSPAGRLSLRQVSIGNLQLVVPTNEDIGRLLYYLRSYEPRETAYLLERLRPDDICFDVGASIGYYTVLMANVVRQGKVHAFEPDPLCHALLQLNVQINRLENVVVNCLALGKQPGKSRFVRSTDSGFNSFRDTHRRAVSSIIEVRVGTVDEYMTTHAVPRIDFLKVDVEGAEGLVLAGAKALLEDPARQPRLLLVELFEENHKPFGDSIEEIIASLRRSNYEPLSATNPVSDATGLMTRPVNLFFRIVGSSRRPSNASDPSRASRALAALTKGSVLV